MIREKFLIFFFFTKDKIMSSSKIKFYNALSFVNLLTIYRHIYCFNIAEVISIIIIVI